jgi:hypothetical protein
MAKAPSCQTAWSEGAGAGQWDVQALPGTCTLGPCFVLSQTTVPVHVLVSSLLFAVDELGQEPLEEPEPSRDKGHTSFVRPKVSGLSMKNRTKKHQLKHQGVAPGTSRKAQLLSEESRTCPAHLSIIIPGHWP